MYLFLLRFSWQALPPLPGVTGRYFGGGNALALGNIMFLLTFSESVTVVTAVTGTFVFGLGVRSAEWVERTGR
jgi:hypothetical protein